MKEVLLALIDIIIGLFVPERLRTFAAALRTFVSLLDIPDLTVDSEIGRELIALFSSYLTRARDIVNDGVNVEALLISLELEFTNQLKDMGLLRTV